MKMSSGKSKIALMNSMKHRRKKHNPRTNAGILDIEDIIHEQTLRLSCSANGLKDSGIRPQMDGKQLK